MLIMKRLIIRSIILVITMGLVLLSGMTGSVSNVSLLSHEDLFYSPVVEKLWVTAYSSRVCETDDTPFITSTGDSVGWGTVAFSRDLLHYYGYGTLVYIEKMGLFRIADTMHRRKRRQIDVWFPETHEAKIFGIKNLDIYIFPPGMRETDNTTGI